MTESISNLYALLIGIDCYLPNRLPDGNFYKTLSGCVCDINQVEAFLKNLRQVPETQIFKLTATSSPHDPNQPLEPPEKLPTRQNIVDSFRQLSKIAPAGSQVYIHYSGHGGRAKTIFSDIKGIGEIDEGLVPTDIGTPEGQYLRDLELAQLLQELVEQKLTVTLVLDCCHSGGATRGDAEIRGMNVKDDKPLPAKFEPVAAPEVLAETWQNLTGATTRGLKASGIPESENYVVLAACRQNEYAYEYAFNRESKERNGVLTYWLLDTLKQQNPGQTYKDLYDRLNAQIHSQFPSQTPLLLGKGDRLIFSQEQAEVVFAVPVLKVEKDTKTATLQAVLGIGQAHGISKGAELAIYPRGTTDLTQKQNRVAIAKILQRGSTDSLCQLEAIEGKELKVEPGDQGVLIAVAMSLVKKVSLYSQEEATPQDLAQSQLPPNKLRAELFAKQQGALDAIKMAIVGNGWVELDETVTPDDNGAAVNFIVAINNNGEYEICPGGSFAPFKNLNPPLKINDGTAPEKLVKRLVHLAKYQAAKAIDNFDTDSPLAGQLAVAWLGTSDIYERGDPMPTGSQMKKFFDPTKPTARVGDHIFLSIQNNSAAPLNVAVLNFAADWSVEQIHPASPTEQFITLEPGKQEIIPLQIAIEGEGEEIENTVKVFATKDQANFRWLELPSLDEQIAQKGFVTRSINPLEALLAAIDEQQPKTRSLRVAASPSRDWTTKQVSLLIQSC